MRALRAALVATLALLFLVPAGAALAQSPDAAQGLRGVLKGPGGAGVAGVSISVTEVDGGSEIGTATSDGEGAWQVPLDDPGIYDVVLDSATLPADVQLRNVGGERLGGVEVRAGQQRTVIFPFIPAGQDQQAAATPPPVSGGTASPAPGGATPDAGTAGDAPAALPANLAGKSKWEQALQLLVESLKFGAIIAMTAVGLSLVFGTTRLINFAHGELVTIGAIAAFFLSSSPGNWPLILATVVAIGIGALAAGSMEVGLWKPLRKRGTGLIQMFIVSIGLSLLLRHIILILFGSRRRPYNEYTVQTPLTFGPVSIAPRDLIVVVLSAIVLVGVALLLLKTRIGKAARAVADNRDLAESSGIDVDRVVLVIWVIGGGLAALGGVFYGLTAQAVYWDMGFTLLLLMFAGVILGGLGSAFGAMLGSFVVALVAQMSTLWFPIDLQFAWALLALILVLLVRPQGILGRAERAG